MFPENDLLFALLSAFSAFICLFVFSFTAYCVFYNMPI